MLKSIHQSQICVPPSQSIYAIDDQIPHFICVYKIWFALFSFVINLRLPKIDIKFNTKAMGIVTTGNKQKCCNYKVLTCMFGNIYEFLKQSVAPTCHNYVWQASLSEYHSLKERQGHHITWPRSWRRARKLNITTGTTTYHIANNVH